MYSVSYGSDPISKIPVGFLAQEMAETVYSSPHGRLTKILNSDSPLLTVSSVHKFNITPLSIYFKSKAVLCITLLNGSYGGVRSLELHLLVPLQISPESKQVGGKRVLFPHRK